ncbi:putative cytochrome P450 monooxygenase [Coniochaeta ligniaria NRRL 30616]|uniref:Putative cytochrome P450 monooxygenase n=1 Tax=Coniochaeta ligniaria NRRL 30616 TaxID=1408157 RepID=A0A1J7J657_9PEZI|nr:putative cytochrome P450 monooxygenase [Coniochaeta ligniaria NRRL 30616]
MVQLSYTGLVALAALFCTIAHAIYNLYFHPLAKFPGPFLHRASRLPFIYRMLRGTLPTDVLAFHERYGTVVRLAPNELAFASHQAWRDIYGHKPGQDELPKSKLFYRNTGMPPSIVSEDKENHALLRRLLANGFSDRSMREQEPIIGSYVDLLIRRLREYSVDRDAKDETTGLQQRRKLDMTAWYNWTTFDIIGDLAFGEPFGCLDRAKYHPWVAAIGATIHSATILLIAKLLGLQPLLLPIFKRMMKGRKEHGKRTQEKLNRRMEMKVERHDLIEPLLTIKDELGPERLRINASTLIIAGSETTATLLTGVTYLLLSNPDTFRKLTDEVRSSFKSDDEITLLSVGSLTYMFACLNEALRVYPPVAGGMPRSTPNGEATIDGYVVPKDTSIAVWQWATNHRSANFKEPFAFRPERWMHDPRYAGDDLDAVRPFSVGPRDCVGKNLAYAEMRLILAKVVYNFDMELADKDVDWLQQKVYTLWSKPPLNVYLTPRKA